MTALHQYDRLEASGRMFSDEAPEGRDVIISLGEASLILSDPRSDRPLAHWSLASVVQISGNDAEARYSPGCESEVVETSDPVMISAIRRIQNTLVEVPERRTRRWVLRFTFMAFLFAGAAVLWEGKFIAARYWPARLDRTVSASLVEQVAGGGHLCRSAAAEAALSEISLRALGSERQMLVIRNDQSAHVLPDGSILLPWEELKNEPDEARLLGMLLMLDLDASRLQAREIVGQQLGQQALIQRFAGIKVQPDRGHLTLSRPVFHDVGGLDQQLNRFERARISTRPWALSIDPSGEDMLDWIEADPHPEGTAHLMPEYRWWAVRNACRPRSDANRPDLDGANPMSDSSN